jgi:hypothetical protein
MRFSIPGDFTALRRVLVAAFFFLIAGFSSVFAANLAQYRGFTIDETDVRGLANLDAVRAAIREQVDITCAVGLPEDLLKFFQGVPFQIVRDNENKRSPGLYAPRAKKVEVTSRIVAIGHKPVLLHELLHAYHDQRLKGGYGNREIFGFYAEGQRLDAFARNSHMLKNDKEYFACAATAYLFGVTAQEPFTRKKLQENHPKFFDYLKTLFGPEAGSYVGSLTR